jgi:hypothetical protein
LGENVTIPEESLEEQDENSGESPEEQTSRAISENWEYQKKIPQRLQKNLQRLQMNIRRL